MIDFYTFFLLPRSCVYADAWTGKQVIIGTNSFTLCLRCWNLFYLLIDSYNISVIDRSPSPGDNILPPTGKHFKRIPRAQYPGYQRFFLCLGILRCRPQCRRIFGQRPNQRVAMITYDLNRKPRTLEKSLEPRVRARTITKISLT